ncbi:hypothetical protein BJ138DRAFT_1118354 [Hygrophoropsis aurantiaca]|uniref:Uncharacterized protein n=1 Tax=Hygrophoropsis aurantiaca TaxID=72124 RepID=A0ACB7ZXV7_9AGAM|nr:hypothetical protein BJ138DRAFT_1118354 [Hygrophoropsis aurantiaca]
MSQTPPNRLVTNLTAICPMGNRSAISRDVLAAAGPLEGWLRNPAWIDGGVNLPQFYPSHQEINDTLGAAGGPAIWSPNVAPPSQPLLPVPPKGQHENNGTPLVKAGHLVSVTKIFSAAEKMAGRNAKMTIKKSKTIKSDHIKLEGTTHIEFIKAILRVHDLGDQLSPGQNYGPDFKFWYTCSR